MTRREYAALRPGDVVRLNGKLRVVVWADRRLCAMRRVGYTWTGRSVVTHDAAVVRAGRVTGARARLTAVERLHAAGRFSEARDLEDRTTRVVKRKPRVVESRKVPLFWLW